MGARPKPRWRGKKSGPNPTDRAKQGTKRSLLVEASGVPLAVVVAGANRNDHKLLGATLAQLPARRPLTSLQRPQGLCLDKGYDYPQTRRLALEYGLTLHLRTRGEEIHAKATEPGYQPHRWVVERTHRWLNRFRRLLVRWEKKAGPLRSGPPFRLRPHHLAAIRVIRVDSKPAAKVVRAEGL